MIHVWPTVIRSNHYSLCIDFFLIPNREKHKIGSFYFINGVCLLVILWRMKNSMTFKDKTKASEEIASLEKVVLGLKQLRSTFSSVIGATLVEMLEKDCFVLFCFAFYAR